MVPKTKTTAGRERTQHLNMAYLEALVAHRGRPVFLKEPSIPGLAKQKDTPGGKDPITGIIAFKSEPNAARGSASLLHRVDRAKHIGPTGSNHTWVRPLDIGPEAINSPVAGPVLRSPQRAPTSGSQGDAGDQNLNLCHILVKGKACKTRGAEFPKESRSASFQSIPNLRGSMFRQRQVNASNFKLGAGFPNVRGLVGNLSKITQGLVHTDTDSLRGNRKPRPFACIEAHGNVALAGIGAGRT